jgi:hypothetical protein
MFSNRNTQLNNKMSFSSWANVVDFCAACKNILLKPSQLDYYVYHHHHHHHHHYLVVVVVVVVVVTVYYLGGTTYYLDSNSVNIIIF